MEYILIDSASIFDYKSTINDMLEFSSHKKGKVSDLIVAVFPQC